jgi:hypothetical protein
VAGWRREAHGPSVATTCCSTRPEPVRRAACMQARAISRVDAHARRGEDNSARVHHVAVWDGVLSFDQFTLGLSERLTFVVGPNGARKRNLTRLLTLCQRASKAGTEPLVTSTGCWRPSWWRVMSARNRRSSRPALPPHPVAVSRAGMRNDFRVPYGLRSLSLGPL